MNMAGIRVTRFTILACLAMVGASVFWVAVPSVAGRNYPTSTDAGGRHLTSYLDTILGRSVAGAAGGAAGGIPRLIVPIVLQPTPVDGNAAASANAAAAANAAATAVPVAGIGATQGGVPGAIAAPAASSDAVAFAAAQALGAKQGGTAGGINIVSSAPMALSNPIDIYQKQLGFSG